MINNGTNDQIVGNYRLQTAMIKKLISIVFQFGLLPRS